MKMLTSLKINKGIRGIHWIVRATTWKQTIVSLDDHIREKFLFVIEAQISWNVSSPINTQIKESTR